MLRKRTDQSRYQRGDRKGKEKKRKKLVMELWIYLLPNARLD